MSLVHPLPLEPISGTMQLTVLHVLYVERGSPNSSSATKSAWGLLAYAELNHGIRSSLCQLSAWSSPVCPPHRHSHVAIQSGRVAIVTCAILGAPVKALSRPPCPTSILRSANHGIDGSYVGGPCMRCVSVLSMWPCACRYAPCMRASSLR